MKKSVVFFAVYFVLFFNSIPELLSQKVISQKSVQITDSWYLLLGLGYSDISYPMNLESLINFMENETLVMNLPFNFNMGVYFPILNDYNLIGVVIEGDLDFFDYSTGSIQIYSYIFGVSMIQHITGYIGNGIYIRGDAGMAFGSNSYEFGDETYSKSSESGFGLRLGGGFEFPIATDNDSVWMQLDISFTIKNIDDNKYKSLGFGLGFLF